MSADTVIAHLQRWLGTYHSGCKFATRLSRNNLGVMPYVVGQGPERFDSATVEKLNDFLEGCAAESKAGIIIFPHVRAAGEVVKLIATFAADERWACKRIKPKGFRGDDVLIGLWWTTPLGHQSYTMGLAPLSSMPVTRRAPYVALLVWPGGHENPYFTVRNNQFVSLVDMRHDREEEEYRAWWDESSSKTAALFEIPPDEAKLYRKVAFCLEERVLADHAPGLLSVD